ncbi:MAG: hypothetical protein E7271_11455 [Lachnospiraceae bacterium]|jgi:RNA-binding protein YlmH|nr:hypothetical protein [Lachnospiraceae bacterium]
MDTGIDIKKRLRELSDKAYRENRYVFTDFVNISQLSTYYEMKSEFSNAGSEAFGGVENAERCIIRFGDADMFGYEEDYPITLLKISPVNRRFADKLSHRDFLGSIIGLGLEREKIGDIIVNDESSCYVFVMDNVAEYIIQNLGFVKHTNVKVEICDETPTEVKPKLSEMDVIVSSNRLDAIIAKVYNMSREVSVRHIAEGKVFLNGIVMTGNAKSLKSGDVVSVRGYGKFVFNREGGNTRKDRLYVNISKYV